MDDMLDPDSRRACDCFLRDLRRGFVRVCKPTVVEQVKLDSFLDCQGAHWLPSRSSENSDIVAR